MSLKGAVAKVPLPISMDTYQKAKPAAEVYKVAGPARFEALRDECVKVDGSLNVAKFSTKCKLEMDKPRYRKSLKQYREQGHLL